MGIQTIKNNTMDPTLINSNKRTLDVCKYQVGLYLANDSTVNVKSDHIPSTPCNMATSINDSFESTSSHVKQRMTGIRNHKVHGMKFY